MTRVHYHAAAEVDLIEAWLQIAIDSIARADNYIDRLQEVCELLADQPRIGLDRPDVAAGVKAFPVDNCVIYYEQHREGISVLRFWHAARDPKTFSID